MDIRKKKLLIYIVFGSFVLVGVIIAIVLATSNSGIKAKSDQRDDCNFKDHKDLPKIFIKETHMINVKVKVSKDQHAK